MSEQDKGTTYEQALRRKEAALEQLGVASQQLAVATVHYDDAMEELNEADRDLAKVVGLRRGGSKLP